MSSLRRALAQTPNLNKISFENTPISSKNQSPKIIQIIEQKLTKQTEILSAKIDEALKNIIGDWENKMKNIHENLNDLTKRVDEFENTVPLINDLKNEINDLKRQINRQENIAVSCNLRLCGVPMYDNENLFDIFSCLCNSLKIVTPNVNTIQRVKNYKNKTQNDGIILVKLFSPIHKNFILKTVANFKRDNKTQITLNMCGFDSNKPIFLNEDLTRYNYQILQAGLKLKKQRKIVAAFTFRGIVYVKQNDSDRGIRVETLEQLTQLFRSTYRTTTTTTTADNRESSFDGQEHNE